jgi:TonB family protein
VLASNIPIQVTGDLAGSLQRDPKALAKSFDDNATSLNDVYRNALSFNPGLSDGMIMRLHLTPDGTVSSGAVRTSTAPNPSLDAEAVKAAGGWRFPPASGTGVDVDYPLIFATSPADAATVEADLKTKLASLGPNESPEYAYTTTSPEASPAGTPALAAVPPAPAIVASPPPVVAETPAPHHRRRMASVPRPTPSISERLNDELAANKKLRRVHAYAVGGNVTLTGKVFDDGDKRLAENTARNVRGVTSVTNNLTTDQQDWAMNAARITQQLQAAGLTGVTVRVIGKTAYLNGTVSSAADRERAVMIAQSAAPVTVRVNLINVAPGRVFGF